MAAAMLAHPGSEFGPCAFPECGHRDCQATRTMAETLCRACGLLIGYDRRFYSEHGPPGIKDRPLRAVLVHAFCLEREVERERVAELNQEREGGCEHEV